MAATNTTTNYGFPLYNDSDSTSWADFNKLSTDVDTQIKNVADSGGTTQGQVEELTSKVDTLTQTVNAQDAVITQQGTEITTLKNDAATTDEAIDGLQQKTNANETNISNLSTQVTGTILPEVQSNTTDIAALTGNVNTLSATVSQQGTRITSLEGKVPNDLGVQLTTLANGLDNVESEIAGGFKIITGDSIDVTITGHSTTSPKITTTQPLNGFYLLFGTTTPYGPALTNSYHINFTTPTTRASQFIIGGSFTYKGALSTNTPKSAMLISCGGEPLEVNITGTEINTNSSLTLSAVNYNLIPLLALN